MLMEYLLTGPSEDVVHFSTAQVYLDRNITIVKVKRLAEDLTTDNNYSIVRSRLKLASVLPRPMSNYTLLVTI